MSAFTSKGEAFPRVGHEKSGLMSSGQPGFVGRRKPVIIVAGFFSHPIYEEQLCRGLQAAGADVHPVRLLTGFGALDRLRRWQPRGLPGIGIVAANLTLLAACRRYRPDAVFAWQQIPWLLPWAAERIRRSGARLAVYSNDDPFGVADWPRRFRHFSRTVQTANVCYSYRRANVEEYERLGATRVELLRSAFDPALHRPIAVDTADRRRLGSDAVFIGHYEPDGRGRLFDALANGGVDVRIFGPGWKRRTVAPARAQLVGEEYVRALRCASIGLVVLSRRNRDEYTRRCFEIPATGTFMLAPRTAELQELFREGEEAAFFDGPSELLAQAKRYLRDDALRERVAAGGLRRVQEDGHDIDSRSAFVLKTLLPG